MSQRIRFLKISTCFNGKLLFACFLFASLILIAPVVVAKTVERNWAGGKPANQSSTALEAGATRAVDGNRDGSFVNGSVTHTNLESHPFWEVDLGAVVPIDLIRLFNRIDCCRDRLRNVFVFVSTLPFPHSDPGDTLQDQGVQFSVIWGDAGDPLPPHGSKSNIHTIRFPERIFGRYVRVQLAGAGILSLAEVEAIQQENIAGPAVADDVITWAPTGIKINTAAGFTVTDVQGILITFHRGFDGTLHVSREFADEKSVPGSPQMAAQVSPAAVWDSSSDIVYVAVATNTGELQIAEGKLPSTPFGLGLVLGRLWSWSSIGRTARPPDVAIGCGKVVTAWLDGNRIRTARRNLGSGPWSAPRDINVDDAVSPPSLATTWLNDFGLAFLRRNGAISFVGSQCTENLDFLGVQTLIGRSWGDRVSIVSYGRLFALATIGGDARPYFTLQVDTQNGLPRWPGFEPVRALGPEDVKIVEAPQLTIYRGLIFVSARDTSFRLRTWLRQPNSLAAVNPRGWLGGLIVGGAGTSSTPPRLQSLGRITLLELENAPAELYVITAGINDHQLYALNFGRSVSLDLLTSELGLLVPTNLAGYDNRSDTFMDLRLAGNLPEQLLAVIGLPPAAWDAVRRKQCNGGIWPTQLYLDPVAIGQHLAGCPLKLLLNSSSQSARFMMHEWMHADFAQRGIGKWRGFDGAFGDPEPKTCEKKEDCGGDECSLADPDVAWFDNPTITRWAGHKVCKDGERPQGGVYWYEMDSAEHAFIETAVRYRWHGDELRSLASRDLGRANGKLQARYNWLKTNYFSGQEFNGWSSSGFATHPGFPAGDRSLGHFGKPLR
jgi:hypothetical protein